MITRKFIATTQLLDFLEICHKEMFFSDAGMDFDGRSVKHTIDSSTENGGCLFVDEHEDIVLGAFAAMVVPNIMDYTQERAIEYIWHTRPGIPKSARYKGMRNLLHVGSEWAKEKGLYLVVGTSAHKPAAGKILINAGFVELETSYGKE